MCGIVGYIGKHQAAPIILEGLAKLEYRGYDSTGMAVFDGKKINIQKAAGRLQVLENMTRGGETMPQRMESQRILMRIRTIIRMGRLLSYIMELLRTISS